MIDFEVFKVSPPYTAKDREIYHTVVNQKLYNVPREMRNANREKLQKAFDKGMITPVKVKETLTIK